LTILQFFHGEFYTHTMSGWLPPGFGGASY